MWKEKSSSKTRLCMYMYVFDLREIIPTHTRYNEYNNNLIDEGYDLASDPQWGVVDIEVQ